MGIRFKPVAHSSRIEEDFAESEINLSNSLRV